MWGVQDRSSVVLNTPHPKIFIRRHSMKQAEYGKEMEDKPEAKPAAQPAPAPAATQVEYIAEHIVKPDETLSHLALKYYGSAIREKWMVIYEANKAAIGDDPAHVKPGTILKIPKLPGG
jgi:nucleoid-associated protein YgaU